MCIRHIIRQLFAAGKMGRKRDLTDDEMAKIVNWLSEGYKTIEIAKMLSRDHCTIKRFVSVSL